MPMFMAQFAYTPQAWATLIQTPAGPRGGF
jgi:hypothetical protein